jgi:signal transduction histidine kinase
MVTPKLRIWLWSLPLMAVSLGLIGLAGMRAWRQPYDGLDWSSLNGTIVAIAPQGPAVTADIQVGDTVVAIDGIPLHKIASLYGGQAAGDRVTFTLVRQGQRHEADITLASAPFPLLLQILEPALIAGGLWLIGALVLALRPASSEARLFFVVNQLASSAFATGILSTFGLQVSGSIFNLCLCWLAPLLVHFHATFPAPWPNARRGQLLKFFYGLAGLLSLPYATISLSQLRSMPAYLVIYGGVRGFFALAVLAATALLLHNYRFISSRVVRQRIRVSLFGTTLALTPLVLASVLPAIVYGSPLLPYPVSFAFSLLSPLAYAYAIYRFNLFETDRVLNRSLVYFTLALFWAGGYLAVLALLNHFVPTAMPLGPWVGALLILFLSAVLPLLQKSIQKGVDRLFYGGWYDYQAIVARFSQALSVTLDECDLAELLIEQLPLALRVRAAALLLWSENGGLRVFCPKLAEGRPCSMPGKCLGCRLSANPPAAPAAEGQRPAECKIGPGSTDMPLAPEVQKTSALVQFLRLHNHPIEVGRLRLAVGEANVTASERPLLRSPDIQLWQPLVFQDEVEGVLLLGAKLADDAYGSDDDHILRTLAGYAAATARNVRLVRELRQRLDEIALSKRRLQEMHYRLLAGREEERKRLAREIHDGPVQALIGLSYQLRNGMLENQGRPPAEMLRGLRERSLALASELRELCADLRPPALDMLGLAAAIRTHVFEGLSAEPAITLDLQDKPGMLSQEMAITLFRIYQEAVTNAVRHADATQVRVRLEMETGICTLVIQDDGRGFALPRKLEDLVQQKHFGLMGMQERAKALGGRLEVVSAPKAGTEIKVWIPLNERLAESAEAG